MKRARLGATHGVVGAVGGTGLVMLARKIGEPYQTAITLAAPTLSFVWALIVAWLLAALASRQLERITEQTERGLVRLEAYAAKLPPGTERKNLEKRIREIRERLVKRHVEALKELVDHDAPANAPRGRRRA